LWQETQNVSTTGRTSGAAASGLVRMEPQSASGPVTDQADSTRDAHDAATGQQYPFHLTFLIARAVDVLTRR
jgi:hypothetical protein